MLLLERKIDEELELNVENETLKIKICRVKGKRVLLGFDGNEKFKILRSKNIHDPYKFMPKDKALNCPN